jgi:signal transduction histidine kinase
MKNSEEIDSLIDIEALVIKIAVISWVTVCFFSGLDFYNKSYFSASVMGIGGNIIFPLIIFLNYKKKSDIARLLLVIGVNFFIFIATAATPYDDGGRYFFIPISLMSLILFDESEKKSLVFSMSLPIVCYFLSNEIIFPLKKYSTEAGISVELSKTINFIMIYSITLILIYFFTTHIKILKKRAIEQSKFSALGIMSAGIAHEINNPLAIIIGRAELIAKQISLKNDTNIEVHLLNIIKTADRISKIITGLRSFSRETNTDPFVKVISNNLISAAIDLCSEKLNQNQIKLTVNTMNDFVIMGSEGQLIQVLVNLINNSCDAIQLASEKWIQIEVQHDQIKVIDSGQGISRKIANKIMQPFFTTKEPGKGTGLGLSISKGIIEKHGGEIILDESSPNTTFIIRFNRTAPQS